MEAQIFSNFLGTKHFLVSTLLRPLARKYTTEVYPLLPVLAIFLAKNIESYGIPHGRDYKKGGVGEYVDEEEHPEGGIRKHAVDFPHEVVEKVTFTGGLASNRRGGRRAEREDLRGPVGYCRYGE